MQAGERLNVGTHLAGLVLSLAWGGGLLLDLAARGGAQRIAAVAVFSLCCAAMYSASVLFHGSGDRSRQRWQRVDHSAIHALIAGSLTAFVLVGRGGAWAWTMLAAVWLVAMLCIRREMTGQGPGRGSVTRYLALGWCSVLAAVPIAIDLDPACLHWLLAGAALYSLGAVVFYRNPWRLRHGHGLWHLCVVGGTTSHFAAVSRALA